MRRQLPVLIAVLVVLGLGLAGYQALFGPDDTVTLSLIEVSGEVERVDALGGRESLVLGAALAPRDQVRVGQSGRAVLEVGEGSTLTLEPSSSIRVTQVEQTGVRVELEEGRVQAKVRAGSPLLAVEREGQRVEVDDGEVVVSEDEGLLQVEGRKGTARVSGIQGVQTVGAGERLVQGEGGETVRGPAPEDLLQAVRWPDAKATRADEIVVEGNASAFARVAAHTDQDEVAGRADASGRFRLSVPLVEGPNEILLMVTDAFGGVRESRHQIVRDTQAPEVTQAEVIWKR